MGDIAYQNKLGELKRIMMVVIYTTDVESADSVYDLEGLILNGSLRFWYIWIRSRFTGSCVIRFADMRYSPRRI